MTQIFSGKMNYSLVFFSSGHFYLWLLSASHHCVMSNIPEFLFNSHYGMVYRDAFWDDRENKSGNKSDVFLRN